jgi:hypothetical protein
VQYQSPNFSGFQVTGAIKESQGNSSNHNVGFDGKATYDFSANDVNGRIWVGGIHQKRTTAAADATFDVQGFADAYTALAGVPTVAQIQTALNANYAAATGKTDVTARAAEIGGKLSYAGAELVGYYYDGKNMSRGTIAGATTLTGLFAAAGDLIGGDRDNDGGYVQATYVLPTKTKIGASWGESNINATGAETQDYSARSWVVGAYHPLTKHLNLVAEYTDTKYENLDFGTTANNTGKAKTAALGAILFF